MEGCGFGYGVRFWGNLWLRLGKDFAAASFAF